MKSTAGHARKAGSGAVGTREARPNWRKGRGSPWGAAPATGDRLVSIKRGFTLACGFALAVGGAPAVAGALYGLPVLPRRCWHGVRRDRNVAGGRLARGRKGSPRASWQPAPGVGGRQTRVSLAAGCLSRCLPAAPPTRKRCEHPALRRGGPLAPPELSRVPAPQNLARGVHSRQLSPGLQ